MYRVSFKKALLALSTDRARARLITTAACLPKRALMAIGRNVLKRGEDFREWNFLCWSGCAIPLAHTGDEVRRPVHTRSLSAARRCVRGVLAAFAIFRPMMARASV